MRTAAIGIGSNSLRMLLADVADGKLNRLGRYREGLRVFAALDENRNISPDMLQKACESVEAFRAEAVAQGAEKVHLFATSAVRDAANQHELAHALRQYTGLELEVCSGDEEACLSFWGACGDGPTGLIDIGGGSTEIATGCGRHIDAATSLQLGAVRLFRKYPVTNFQDAMQVAAAAEEIVKPFKANFTVAADQQWVGVGGTFTTAAALVQRIPWQRREMIHGYVLTPQSVLQSIELLAALSYKERLTLDFLQPQRADIIVHGLVILLACMKSLDISSIMVSEYGNLEGYIKNKYIF